MKHILFSLVLAFIFVASAAHAGPVEDGIALYQQQDYVAALPKLKTAAEAGHKDAHHYLGLMYYHGRGATKSHEKARQHYQTSANDGHADSALELGYMFENGLGGPKDLTEAVRWYRDSAERGNAIAQRNMGNVYSRGLTVEQSYQESAKWYEKSAANGSAKAALNLGYQYEIGQGVGKSLSKALTLYRQAAEGGNVTGMTNLAYMHYTGMGTPVSHADAARWFRKAGNQGGARAQYFLGELHEHGRGVPQSKQDAFVWYKKAAAQDYEGAQEKVNDLSTGLDLAKQAEAKAEASRRLSRQQKPNYNKMTVGSLQEACTKTRADFKACRELYSRIRGLEPESYVVAEHICLTGGYSAYCYDAGIDLYSGGAGVSIDKPRAYNNFRSACHNRSMKSCYMAGYMAFAGDGIRTDLGEAYLLFNLSCTGGYRDSCALMKQAKRADDRAIEARNRGIRQNSDDAMNCKKTRIIGHGGRAYTSYDCRTNRQWRTGKK